MNNRNKYSYLKVPVTIETTGYVDSKNILNSLIEHLGIKPIGHYADIVYDENGVYEIVDKSHHSSADYQRRLITDDRDKIDAYTHIIGLMNALQRLEDKNDNK